MHFETNFQTWIFQEKDVDYSNILCEVKRDFFPDGSICRYIREFEDKQGYKLQIISFPPYGRALWLLHLIKVSEDWEPLLTLEILGCKSSNQLRVKLSNKSVSQEIVPPKKEKSFESILKSMNWLFCHDFQE